MRLLVPHGFVTDRICACVWSETNPPPAGVAPALDSLLSEPVLAPLPTSLHREPGSDGALRWLSARRRESEVLGLSLRESRELVGILLVATSPARAHGLDVHIGYLFGEMHWGNGYAQEVLRGLIGALSEGGEQLDVYGGIGGGNEASARVLEKCGFRVDPARSDATTTMYHRMIG